MKTKLRDSKLKEGLEDCTGGRVQAAHIFEKLTEEEILDERWGSVWRPHVSQASPAFRRAATKSNLDSTTGAVPPLPTVLRITVLVLGSVGRPGSFHCLIYLPEPPLSHNKQVPRCHLVPSNECRNLFYSFFSLFHCGPGACICLVLPHIRQMAQKLFTSIAPLGKAPTNRRPPHLSCRAET